MKMSAHGTMASAGTGTAAALRHEIAARNQEYASKNCLAHCLSYGEQPVVCYEPEAGGHGNFIAASYRAIVNDPEWTLRLQKVHTQARTSLPRNGRVWRELDSCNSSDALLMNIFCYPRVFAGGRLRALLGFGEAARPKFGVRARVPLANGHTDRTEIDMQLADLLVEAKLTESDFQWRDRNIVEGYRDFAEVFERRELPRRNHLCGGYQLIRNVLAAHAGGNAFTVLCDARRQDLREQWYAVLRCVKPLGLRVRMKMFTWQEVAGALPGPLQRFLEEKYGITAATGSSHR
jgi:hypothetical protein